MQIDLAGGEVLPGERAADLVVTDLFYLQIGSLPYKLIPFDWFDYNQNLRSCKDKTWDREQNKPAAEAVLREQC